jgi:hypothetical protein
VVAKKNKDVVSGGLVLTTPIGQPIKIAVRVATDEYTIYSSHFITPLYINYNIKIIKSQKTSGLLKF